jgi:hypothetical protein
MLFDEIDSKRRASVTCNTPDFVNSRPVCGDGIVAELETRTRSNAVSYVDFVKHHKDRGVAVRFQAKVTLSSQAWHRPYAAALMEPEPAKRAPLIDEAERAIFGRYLELCVAPASIEHSIDLQNAVCYLLQLKEANSR